MATTKATTLAHTLGGISSDISTAEINRLDGVTGDLQTQLDAKAPTASPTFTGTITAPNDSISGDAVSGGTIGAGTFNGTVGASATINDGVTYANKPIIVWAGWNTSESTISSTWTDVPLDVDVVSVNTTYMTKSTNTFTVVKAGTYLVNLNTMSNLDYGEYAHIRMRKNNVHYISTHDYGSSSSDKWAGQHYSVVVPGLAVNDTLDFMGYKNGGSYLWHGGSSYSQLNILYMYS